MCCFSERQNSLLMWSHYADSGRGICIQYCLNDIDCSYLHPVYYSNEMHDLSVKESNIPLMYIIKAEDWKYEEEWRIVFLSDGLPSENHYVKIPIPTKILLGPRFDDNIDKELTDKLYSIANYKQIPIIRTKLHSSKYEIIACNE